MNATIWKFPLKLTDVVTIDMPEGAEVLTVQLQNGDPYLWAIVNPERNKEPRTFEIHGTGNPMNNDGVVGVQRRYIGTYQSLPFVWHVFEQL